MEKVKFVPVHKKGDKQLLQNYRPVSQHSTLEVRANFLDISKALDKVWHEGLLFKLERIGISGNLLSLLKSFLSNRFQQVVLNGQCSS